MDKHTQSDNTILRLQTRIDKLEKCLLKLQEDNCALRKNIEEFRCKFREDYLEKKMDNTDKIKSFQKENIDLQKKYEEELIKYHKQFTKSCDIMKKILEKIQ